MVKLLDHLEEENIHWCPVIDSFRYIGRSREGNQTKKISASFRRCFTIIELGLILNSKVKMQQSLFGQDFVT